MRPWRCWPSTRWTCSRCCRSASCGWPRPGWASRTGWRPCWRTPSPSSASSAIRCRGRCRCTGRGARGHPRQRPAAVARTARRWPRRRRRALRQGAGGAGRTWLRVLAGQVDPDEVAVAARGLAQFGLTSDATRLAGQAALQADDARASGLMLQLARDLKLAAADTVDEGAADAADPPPRTSAPPGGPRRRRCRTGSARSPNCCCSACPIATSARSCSSRPRRSNITSHRIRRRLGAESRSEMLSMLRAMLAPQA